MTTEPSLFDRVKAKAKYYRPQIGNPGGYLISRDKLQDICAEYDNRMDDLEASNRNMASRLKKLMEKKS